MGASPAILDPRSIILLAGVMGVMMALVVFFMRRSYPRSIQGLGEWSRAPLVAFVSTLLFAARGYFPDFLTIVVANFVLFQACILYYAGSQKFLFGHGDTRGWTALNGMLALLLFWFGIVKPDFEVRLLFVTAAVSALFFRHAQLYMRHKGRVFGKRLMTGLLLAQALVAGLRFVSVVAGMAGSGLMEGSWIQSIYISMYSFTVLLLSIAVILMATDRVHTEFEYLATRDPLTGALNRRALLDACHGAFASGERRGALLMVDLDHFKSINDRFGHQMGDAVLREAVGRMQRAVGDKGLLGRYGGEEFLVLLPDAGKAEAMEVAARLRQAIGEPFPSDSPMAAVGSIAASIGVAAGEDSSGRTDIDDVLALADAALYRAKEMGRDRVIAAA
ncbi:GGDEF domain-containing protein [Variovorax sp. NFACC27]|uniref:diguanylate cyclase n=1 Tax=Variovorax gossypii TaxID=1679495 RepID=A0A3S0GUP3_9BURK|nr:MULTISPECIES: GGDEF domain-containing protein [Variovorax]SEF29531.1 diguanylate cyclase (GGDEF) domain-containing protein [Variovorax sp. NFACC28]SEG93678.1 diguanylate cyclase (GGDEF) domain-containing protein [Variovorax sp. NFACC29]SFD60435.1 diguanylate cyclase (GGDEF) domain-containing protein [Variovorax sp. NFACC26]SFG89938.1 diguanylate cyclase (GGDEF) domain-containing protein [Variovorax sp. NFACC27]RTQ32252.1 GGDEF domain-containing protein [Variovorax gossypii]